MKRKIKCKAVLFDLWNTLLGSYAVMRRTKEIMGCSNYDTKRFIRRFERATMMKPFDSTEDFFASAFREFAIKPDKKKIKGLIFVWKKNAKAKPFPETIRTLHALKKRGCKLAIVSNCQYFGMRNMIGRIGGKRLFDSIQLSFEAHSLKPNPRMYRLALKELHAKPKEAIMVGDSDTDMNGARNAKIRGILIDRRTEKKKRYKAVAAINSLEELLEILEVEKNGSD